MIRDREVGGSNPLAPTIFEERPLKSSGLLLSTLLRVVLRELFLPLMGTRLLMGYDRAG